MAEPMDAATADDATSLLVTLSTSPVPAEAAAEAPAAAAPPAPPAAAPAPTFWACARCTLENDLSAKACAVCEAPRPAASGKRRRTTRATTVGGEQVRRPSGIANVVHRSVLHEQASDAAKMIERRLYPRSQVLAENCYAVGASAYEYAPPTAPAPKRKASPRAAPKPAKRRSAARCRVRGHVAATPRLPCGYFAGTGRGAAAGAAWIVRGDDERSRPRALERRGQRIVSARVDSASAAARIVRGVRTSTTASASAKLQRSTPRRRPRTSNGARR